MKDKKKLFIGIAVFVVIASIITIVLSFSFAAPLENDVKVEEDSELTYYIDVIYDGKDASAVTSGDSATAQVYSDYIYVEDRIPEGLIFKGFVETDDGTIGAVKRSDGSFCAGYVDGGVEGLVFDNDTRTVSFKVKNLQAGCKVTVGIITQTPTLSTGINRMDFYNTAYGREGSSSIKSNTVHAFIGRDSISPYNVIYQYTGDVPTGAPEVPVTTSYVAGSTVSVNQDIEVEGYEFSGWETDDVTVENGVFTMPSFHVTFTGHFTEKEEKLEEVKYTISGEVPDGYLPPIDKSYPVGSDVKLDSLKPGDVINGYRFLGWKTDDVELPPLTTEETTIFTMPNNLVTLVGEFEKISYKVTYQFQGSVIPPNAESLLPKEESYYPGDKVTTAPFPETSGYRFLGWYQTDEFTMPEEDVVIYGEWAIETGTFSPTIKKEIIEKKNYYQEGDIVVFQTTVTNTADFIIKDVLLEEKSEGMEFVAGDGYEVLSSTFVKIPSIPANSYITVESRYTVGNDVIKSIVNTVELTGAVADNNYLLDTSREYKASAAFKVSNIKLKVKKTDEEGNPLVGAKFSLSEKDNLYQTIASQAVMDNISSQYVSSSSGIDFGSVSSDTNGQGVYTRAGTENELYPVHYYRGDVDNNHVKFAGFCWKIVRTTSTGGVKLIYDGLPDSYGYCNNTGTDAQIGTSTFNLNNTSLADVGYMYGTRYVYSSKKESDLENVVYGNDITWDGDSYTLVDTMQGSDWSDDKTNIVESGHRYTCLSAENRCNTVYYIYHTNSSTVYYITLQDGKNVDDALDEMFTNTNDSTVKQTIDSWYAANMTEYTQYLEDTVWCNNRSIYQKNGWDKDYQGTKYLYFGTYGNISRKLPNLSCPSVNDSFTVDRKNGNGMLTYPVSLLTADEVTLAGHTRLSNRTSYLFTGERWYTLSPYYFTSVSAMNYSLNLGGNLYLESLIVSHGIRPAISLSSNVFVDGGNGTGENPYTVFINATGMDNVNTTNSSSTLSFDNLEPDSIYYLREVRAPSGYQLLGKTLIVKVDSKGNVTIDGYDVDNQDGVASVSIANKRINILPNTGGVGVIPYVVIGLLFISIGVIYFVRLFRKKGGYYEKDHK